MIDDKIKMMGLPTDKIKTAEVSDSALLGCYTQDFEELKSLCRQLLDGADKCSKAPHHIVQPFLGIVKQNMKLIQKYELM